MAAFLEYAVLCSVRTKIRLSCFVPWAQRTLHSPCRLSCYLECPSVSWPHFFNSCFVASARTEVRASCSINTCQNELKFLVCSARIWKPKDIFISLVLKLICSYTYVLLVWDHWVTFFHFVWMIIRITAELSADLVKGNCPSPCADYMVNCICSVSPF